MENFVKICPKITVFQISVPLTGTPKNNRCDKFWANLGFRAFLNAVRGKRVRNYRRSLCSSTPSLTMLESSLRSTACCDCRGPLAEVALGGAALPWHDSASQKFRCDTVRLPSWETDFLPVLVLTRRGCSTGKNQYW